MAESYTEKRSGEERREAARRGVGPDLSIEQIFGGESDATAADSLPNSERRVVNLRVAIRRKEDRELNDFLAGNETA